MRVRKIIGKLKSDPTTRRELLLYLENDADIYRQRIVPIAKNFARKMRRKEFNRSKAIKGLIYPIDDAVRKYRKEFGDVGQLSIADKRKIATKLYPSVKELADYELAKLKPLRKKR